MTVRTIDMIRCKSILLSLLLIGSASVVSAENADFPINTSFAETDDTVLTLKVTINEDTEIELENVLKTTNYLDVYNLLGVKVTSVNLKKCVDNRCSLDLNKGLYILKAGKVAKKVIVR